MIEAVIFDMDGLLINSAPFWKQAQQKALLSIGIELTDSMFNDVFGMTTREVMLQYYSRGLRKDKTVDELESIVNSEVEALIRKKGEAMQGVNYILNFFGSRNIRVGLASSSSSRVINAVMEKLDIADRFHEIHSAENEEFGKPHPAVYLSAAKKLGVNPLHCLVFEDSFPGLIAALAARMKTVAVPECSQIENQQFHTADLIIASLEDFTRKNWQELLN